MKCPKCGWEMEEGFLHAEPPVVWSSQKERAAKIAIRSQGEIQIRNRYSELFVPQCNEATVCRKCKMIIMRY